MRFELRRVHYMPKVLEPGVLYVSEEFGAAAHLCACGCGAKIRTPLGPTEWSFEETSQGPTLHPSIGNWQQGCKSHYWIVRGEVLWSHTWTEEQIATGRRAEQERREAYFEEVNRKNRGVFGRFWRWLKSLFGY